MKFSEIFKNWRVMRYYVLAILAVTFVVTVYMQFFYKPKQEEGALRLIQCQECEHKAVKRIKDIANPNEAATHCEKCGKQVGYAYKCEDCDREFSIIPILQASPENLVKLKTMGKFAYTREMYKCPNCGSVRTRPISVPND